MLTFYPFLLLFFVIKIPNCYLHFVDFINDFALSPLELGVGDAGVKSGKCLFYFSRFFIIQCKATE